MSALLGAGGSGGSGSGRTALPTTTFYVRTDGTNTSGGGQSDSAAGAYLTFQFAYDNVVSLYDFRGQAVIIKAGNEAGTKSFVGPNITQPWTGGGSLTLSGNGSTRTTLTKNSFGDIITSQATLPGLLTVTAMKLDDNTAPFCCIGNYGIGTIVVGSDLVLASCGQDQLGANSTGAVISLIGSPTTQGTARSLFGASGGGLITDGSSLSAPAITHNNPSYTNGTTNGVALCVNAGIIELFTTTIGGSIAAGRNFYLDDQSTIFVPVNSLTYLSNGTAATASVNFGGTYKAGAGQTRGYATAGGHTFVDAGQNFGVNSFIGDLIVWNGAGLGWISAGSVDLFSAGTQETGWFREGAQHIGQRSNTSPTAANKSDIYNTFTNASNYERFTVDWQATANVVKVGPEAAGSGTRRPMRFLSPLGSPNYNTAGLPSASTEGAGAIAYNTDLASLVVSDGALWNAAGGAGSKDYLFQVYGDG